MVEEETEVILVKVVMVVKLPEVVEENGNGVLLGMEGQVEVKLEQQ